MPFDPVTGGLIIGGIGSALGFIGSSRQASAQRRMAQAQEAQARAMIEERRKEREMALRFAEPSEAELGARASLLSLQSDVLGRTQRELAFLQRGLDLTAPGAAEAGAGLFSSMIARQRSSDRARLESQLRQRFGAGYASTSAGQSALQQFDMGTSDIGIQAIPQFLQQAYGSIGATTALEGTIKNRQIAASQGTAVAPFMQAALPFAGSQNVGAIQGGAALGQFGSMLGSLGGQALGYGLQSNLRQQETQQFKDLFSASPVSQAPMIASAPSNRFSLGVNTNLGYGG